MLAVHSPKDVQKLTGYADVQVMPLENLPNEILEDIFSRVNRKRGRDSNRDLAALALTSRRLLPLARHHLFHAPFADPPEVPLWPLAVNLEETLARGGGECGKMVRSLSGIHKWIQSRRDRYDLANPDESWYFRVLRLCPRLIRVELLASDDIITALPILAASEATLRHVRFTGYRSRKPPTSLELIRSALHSPHLRNIKTVAISGQLSLDPVSVQSSSLPQLLTSLELSLYRIVFRSTHHCLSFLPEDASQLSYLRLYVMIRDEALPAILNRLTSAIKRLALGLQIPTIRPLAGYANRPHRLPIPVEPFARFTNLLELYLHDFSGLSLSLLRSISSSSPNLRVLSFCGASWTSDNLSISTSPTITYFDSVFPEEEVIRELDNMESLQWVNLGWVPSVIQHPYSKLKKALEERPYWVYSDLGEEEECPICGEFHEHVGEGYD